MRSPWYWSRAVAFAALLSAGCSDDAEPNPSAGSDAATEAGADAPSGDVEPEALEPEAAAEAASDSGDCESPGFDATFKGKLDTTLAEKAEAAGVPGAVAAVLIECDGTWSGAHGAFDLNAGQSLSPDSLMRIASVTKTYTAAIIHLLAEEGKLSLDDMLDQYVMGVPAGDAITIRQLMNHTSGLFDYADDATFDAQSSDPGHTFTPEELVALGTANPAYFAPGEGFHYSNTNYVLLGMIAEKQGGATIGELYHSRLIEPLELDHTLFAGVDAIPDEDLARGYALDGTNFEEVTYAVHPSAPWAAGAMVSNADDVARWGAALLGGRVLSPSSVDALTDCLPTGDEGIGWGAGVSCMDSPLGTLLGHGGGIRGYSSIMLHLPSSKATLVVIANMGNADLDTIMTGLIMNVVSH